MANPHRGEMTATFQDNGKSVTHKLIFGIHQRRILSRLLGKSLTSFLTAGGSSEDLMVNLVIAGMSGPGRKGAVTPNRVENWLEAYPEDQYDQLLRDMLEAYGSGMRGSEGEQFRVIIADAFGPLEDGADPLPLPAS